MKDFAGTNFQKPRNPRNGNTIYSHRDQQIYFP